MCVSPVISLLLCCSEDGTLILWLFDAQKPLRVFRGHTDSVFGVAISPDGKRLFSSSDDKSIVIWDLNTAQKLGVLNPQDVKNPHRDGVLCLAIRGSLLVSGSRDNTVKLWNVSASPGQCLLRTLKGHLRWINSVAITTEGPVRIVSGSLDRFVCVWDSEGTKLNELMDEGLVYGVAISPNGSFAAAGTSENVIRVWDLGTSTLLITLKGHCEYVNAVLFV
jgi:WD40 repeat protein